MSVYDHITPSEQAAELALLVNRMCKKVEKNEVAVLVVEGANDRSLFKPHCEGDQGAVFPAGNRRLVEQLLSHLKTRPVPGCKCVFLTDCDAIGKTDHLKSEASLIVTEACDVEADLVKLGVAKRVARAFLANDEEAQRMLDRACSSALPFSVVRRAAHLASVAMHRSGMQFRLRDLPSGRLAEMEARSISAADALDVIAEELNWSEPEKETVAALLAQVPTDFDSTCMGKDALDALHDLLRREGGGDIRGWNCDHFHQVVRNALCFEDFSNWEVGRRVLAWQAAEAQTLLVSAVADD